MDVLVDSVALPPILDPWYTSVLMGGDAYRPRQGEKYYGRSWGPNLSPSARLP